MHVTFIAGYEWWPLSDPLITFVKYCVQKRISCSLIASPILDFIKNSYPTESEFTELSILEFEDTGRIPELIIEDQKKNYTKGKQILIFFDELSFLETNGISSLLTSDIYLYSTEIEPFDENKQFEFKKLFEHLNPKLIIQDQGRLQLFEKTFSLHVPNYLIMPNASLSNFHYPLLKPRGIDFSDSHDFIILSGSLVKEHAVLEMVELFENIFPGMFLFISGWGNNLLSVLKERISGLKNILLSTRFLSGAEIRWLYSKCYAGIVSYTNEGENHRHCGMSSGKLFWLCRYGKPVICNDNISISSIIESNHLGIRAINPRSFYHLKKHYENISLSCLKFFKDYSAKVERGLISIFDDKS